jgi:hypothetical protein
LRVTYRLSADLPRDTPYVTDSVSFIIMSASHPRNDIHVCAIIFHVNMQQKDILHG